MDYLEERVAQFIKNELPGQPKSVHLGTMYLVTDLWREVQKLRKQLEPTSPFSSDLCICPADGFNFMCPIHGHGMPR
jgi:hypothetical protein